MRKTFIWPHPIVGTLHKIFSCEYFTLYGQSQTQGRCPQGCGQHSQH